MTTAHYLETTLNALLDDIRAAGEPTEEQSLLYNQTLAALRLARRSETLGRPLTPDEAMATVDVPLSPVYWAPELRAFVTIPDDEPDDPESIPY